MESKIAVAFAAGLLSFVTPCVLPLVPGYLSAVSGTQPGVGGRRVVLASLPFIAGFTTGFVDLGALAGVAGGVLADNRPLLLKIAGIVGVGFDRAASAFRWLRDRYGVLRIVSGALLVGLGLLLFFDRFWWLNVAFNRA